VPRGVFDPWVQKENYSWHEGRKSWTTLFYVIVLVFSQLNPPVLKFSDSTKITFSVGPSAILTPFDSLRRAYFIRRFISVVSSIFADTLHPNSLVDCCPDPSSSSITIRPPFFETSARPINFTVTQSYRHIELSFFRKFH
jgi:hypothetical protein